MNSDSVVNVIDLLAVINAWGSCVGSLCGNEDITGNAEIDVNDLLAVINAWGDCGNQEDAPQSVEDCQNKCANSFGTSGSQYTDCVDKCVRALCETGALPSEDCPE